MRQMKYFFIGLLAGLFIMTGISAGYITAQRIRWGGQLNPDSKVRQIFGLLEQHSIYAYDKTELLENMYRGLLDGFGDPYTYYFDPEDLAAFTIQTEGMYVGIGVLVTTDPEDSTVTILKAYPDTPAEQAGLLPGDKIIKVDGTDVIGKQMDEVTGQIKGRAGTKVCITVYRPLDDYRFDVDVMRESISIPTVSHKIYDEAVGYIRIEGFERVTLSQFTDAYRDLTQSQIKGLIIDLRNNPGGLMETVTQIADMLLPKGIITYTEDKYGERKYYNSDENHIQIPLVILVNGNSASASEILGGAVKDMGAGTLVGAQTFGKGIVQNLYPLPDGSAVKITVSKYYTPNGICIQGEGITPDYIVEMDKELSFRAGSLTLEKDLQLQKALEVIWEEINK